MMLAKGTIIPPIKRGRTKFPAFFRQQAADHEGADGAENHLGDHGEADDDNTVGNEGHKTEPDDGFVLGINICGHLEIVFRSFPEIPGYS